ncbi:MAG TPA: hypothetical protein VGO70_10375 [Arsenicitalea sp.]|jgi:uncharacterized Zn finger protein|nr:hypothetical protein [Arsenicitalea sp.]
MASVTDLVAPERMAAMATPANLRLGRSIAADNGVEFLEFGPLLVRARVGGTPDAGQRRTVVLQSNSAGLEWSCTCTSAKTLFCKHCVAMALVTWEKAPTRHSPA